MKNFIKDMKKNIYKNLFFIIIVIIILIIILNFYYYINHKIEIDLVKFYEEFWKIVGYAIISIIFLKIFTENLLKYLEKQKFHQLLKNIKILIKESTTLLDKIFFLPEENELKDCFYKISANNEIIRFYIENYQFDINEEGELKILNKIKKSIFKYDNEIKKLMSEIVERNYKFPIEDEINIFKEYKKILEEIF